MIKVGLVLVVSMLNIEVLVWFKTLEFLISLSLKLYKCHLFLFPNRHLQSSLMAITSPSLKLLLSKLKMRS